ncbi:MAG: hypothetical protein ACYS1A_17705 [Planctomycetota bacterium]|jgi:hypothetical protein
MSKQEIIKEFYNKIANEAVEVIVKENCLKKNRPPGTFIPKQRGPNGHDG